MIRLVSGLLIVTASPVVAHGNVPGGGGFYSGAVHPFLAMEHALLLIGLGLLLGRMADASVGQVTLALLAGLVGGLVGQGLIAVPLTLAILGLGLICSLALIIGSPWTARFVGPVALLAGGLIGADTDGIIDLARPLTTAFASVGLVIGTLLIVLNASALSRFLSGKGWPIVTRVAGSWICAVIILMLALAVGPGVQR